MTKIFSVLIIVLVIVGGYLLLNKKQEPQTNGPIRIGAVFDLTADAADYGEDESRAVRMAVDDANKQGGIYGTQIEQIIEDAPALDMKRNILAFNKLVSVDKVLAVIGPSWDDAATALGPIADKLKIPIIAPDITRGPENTISFDYLFSTWYPQEAEVDKLLKFAASRGVKTLDILRNADPFSEQSSKDVKNTAPRNNIEVINDIKVVNPDTKDFRTYITKLKSDNSDAVFVVLESNADKCPAIKQIKELRLKVLIIGVSSTETAPCPDVLEGTYYSFPRETNKTKKLISNFRRLYGTEPKTPAVPNAYDATMMIISAIREGHYSGEEIQSYLKNIKYDGNISANMSFDNIGHLKLSTEDFFIKTILNGKPTEVK